MIEANEQRIGYADRELGYALCSDFLGSAVQQHADWKIPMQSGDLVAAFYIWTLRLRCTKSFKTRQGLLVLAGVL